MPEEPKTTTPIQPTEVPTPTPAPTSYEQQPVQQQYFAQPNAAPVQYVIATQSLKGLRGWLLFFTVISGLAALGYVGMTIAAFSNVSADSITEVIFAPLLFLAATASVVLTALEKKVAKYTFIGFYVVAYLYQIISAAVKGADTTSLITSIMIGGLWVLFVSLYFITSKRVKETLVK
jgi:hypothetical protein